MQYFTRILITGGTGFFGRAILRSFLMTNYEVNNGTSITVLSRSPEAFLKKYPEFAGLQWLNFHKGDILSYESLPVGEKFSHVIHAATDSTIGPSLGASVVFDQIVVGTKNVLKLALISGVERFLFTSSGAVYGEQPKTMKKIPETYFGYIDPLNPANAYAIAKRAAEHLCSIYHHEYGLKTIIARPFAFIGQDLPLDAHFAIGNFIRDALNGEDIFVKSDGSSIRSYLDQEDLAKVLLALLVDGKPGEAYNVGSDEAISIRDLAHLVRDVLSPESQVIIQGNKEKGRKSMYVPDVAKCQNIINIKATIPLFDALKRFK